MLLFFSCSAETRQPRYGPSIPFVDPDVPAETAHIFWHAEALLHAMPVLSHPPHNGATDRGDVDLHKLSTVRRILIDDVGTEHIVLQADWATITLRNRGMSLVKEPACLTFLTEGVDRIPSAPRLLRLARYLLDPSTSLGPEHAQPAPSWVERKHHALLAFDARCQGATQREIATLLYGKSWTDEAWASNRPMVRQLVRRAIEHALELSGRGYRELLR